jgi:hypothetical protein
MVNNQNLSRVRIEELRMPWQGQHDEKLIETIRDLFQAQSVTLAQQSTSLASQAQRLEQLSMQLSTVVSQHESLRNDFNSRWSELPNVYIPRQEVQAMGHDGRLAALEETTRKISIDIAEMKLAMQQQIQQAVLAGAREIAKVQLDEKSDTMTQRSEVDGRTILMYSTAIFTLLGIVLTIVLHFI